MKRYALITLLIVFPFLVNGQIPVDNRIKVIRKNYQQTLNDKDTYKTQDKDITDKAFISENDSYSKANITYYYTSDSELKLIVLTFSSVGQYSSYNRNIELYYIDSSLCFLYSKRENTQWEEVYMQKGKVSSVMEERIYFDKNQKCIRYLIKEFERKPETIESKNKTTPNIEIDCIDSRDVVENIKKYL